MKKIFFILLLPLNSFCQGFFIQFENFLSSLDDRTKHGLVSEGLVAAQGYSIYHLTNRIGLSLLGGGVTAFGIGYGKERIYDGYFKQGTNSNIDLFWDAFGDVKGIFQLRVEINIEQKNNKKNNYLKFEL